MTLEPKFPADDYEQLLSEAMEDACDAMDREYEWDWPRLKKALLRYIAAQDEGLDHAAIEQEHDE